MYNTTAARSVTFATTVNVGVCCYCCHVVTLLLAVNLPGTYYTISNAASATLATVGAVACPVDTFSPGYRKQRACAPCPTGTTTNGLQRQSKPSACGKCCADC